MHAELKSQDDDVCIRCRLIEGRRHLELDQLQERMIQFEEEIDSFAQSGYQKTGKGGRE